MKRLKNALIFITMFALLTASAPVSSSAAEKSKYKIEVNLDKCIITVFGQSEKGDYNVPVKAFYCTPGRYTPTGTFRTSDKYVWHQLFGGVFGQYCARITDHILFHSVYYYSKNKNNLSYTQYNKLGSVGSDGCVRLCVRDAKWLYDNCESGTTVRIYKGQGWTPITPLKPIKIDANNKTLRGWDPTDPDAANPWKKSVGNLSDYDIAVQYEQGKPITEAAIAARKAAEAEAAKKAAEEAARKADPRPNAVKSNVALKINGEQYALKAMKIDGKYYATPYEIETLFKQYGKDYYLMPAPKGFIIQKSICDRTLPEETPEGKADKSATQVYFEGLIGADKWREITVYGINGKSVYDVSKILEMTDIKPQFI